MSALRVAVALFSASVQLAASSGIGIAAGRDGFAVARPLAVSHVQAPMRPAGLRPAAARSYKVIASFTGLNGKEPLAAPIAVNGALYGTTELGGSYGYGTVYKASTSGTITIIHSFANGSDGAQPGGRLLYEGGKLYGTTTLGGKGYGTVFEIGLSGGEHIVHNFVNTDGAEPYGGLTYANGVFYGTTFNGGTYAQGTVFQITAGGTLRTLHNFNGNSGNGDGSGPIGDLIAVNGSVYGTTTGGGTVVSKAILGAGTVFVINQAGSIRILHVFSGYSFDGHTPRSGLTLVNGLLFGATYFGGNSEPAVGPYDGFGTIYNIGASGTEKVAFSFGQLPDAEVPGSGSLTAIGSVIYGATNLGGAYPSGGGRGAVFSFNTITGAETVLHSFLGYPSDGGYPSSCGVAVVNGTLYGTTENGGTKDMGTLFAITP